MGRYEFSFLHEFVFKKFMLGWEGDTRHQRGYDAFFFRERAVSSFPGTHMQSMYMALILTTAMHQALAVEVLRM